MKFTSDELQSARYAWNSFPGNVHGVLLDRRQPAVALCSYKFYLAQTLTFTLLADGKPCELGEAKIAWHPHKVTAVYGGPDGELILEAMFVKEEVVAIRYTIHDARPGRSMAVRVTGIARNGQDNKQYFDYSGEIRTERDLPVVEQRLDIPDYHLQQVGPIRRAAHYLCWMAGVPAAATYSSSEITTRDPYYLNEANVSGSWQMEQPVLLSDDGAFTDTIYLAVRWLGVSPAHDRDLYELREEIDAARRKSFDIFEHKQRDYYTRLLGKLPSVKPAYRENRDYMALYAESWICIWQNICGDLVTSRKTLPAPSAFVSKVVDNGFGPAQWETALAGYLVSFVDTDLGIGILESIVACVEEDGFLPEDLIFNRDVKLASLEPYMFEEIYRRTGRRDFLDRNYDRLYRQLIFHIRHPGFQYLTHGGGGLAIENFYSLLALERIARIIGRPAAHLEELRRWKDDMTKFLDAAFKKDMATVPVFEFLHQYTDAATAKPILERLRKHHMAPDGRYFMYSSPDGKQPPDGKENLDAYKMVHFLHFILGLEKYGQEDLLDIISANTYGGLRKAGDFWECYYVTGEPWGNGPMSIFGAFGWIWLMMEKEHC